MPSTQLTRNQTIFTIVLFNFGSSVVMGVSTNVKQDSLLAILLATLMAIPVLLMYARILALFPRKNLFDIAEEVLGKIGGKAVAVLFIWYAIHLAALVLRNFTEFTQTSSMLETPQLPIMILMTLTTVYLARSNVRSLGKWSVLAFFALLFVVLFTFAAALPKSHLDDLLPLMEHPLMQILKSSLQVFSFPYAETVIFLCLGDSFAKKKPYGIFLWALGIVMAIFVMVFVRNLVLLGPKMMELSLFPSYSTVRTIGIGDFLARFEGLISSNFFLAGIVKISVCLLAASKGLMRLFSLEDYKPMVVAVGMLAMALCAILYKNLMDMFAFLDYYGYYAFPFQVVIPLILLIAGEIHTRGSKGKPVPGPGPRARHPSRREA